MLPQNPPLDYPTEPTVALVETGVGRSPWAATEPPIHSTDTTSRVVSFVLGFALASLIAWLGRSPEAAVQVAPSVLPVVSAATEEKPSTTIAVTKAQPQETR